MTLLTRKLFRIHLGPLAQLLYDMRWILKPVARVLSFKESLVDRDASCIFTNAPLLFCRGTHIIPKFHKGEEVGAVHRLCTRRIIVLPVIVKNRPASADEDVSTLTTVDDRRNGMLLGVDVHITAESRQLVVVKPRKCTRIPKPSPMLLHYNCEAAAVKWWGRGRSHLGTSNRPAMPRPGVPVAAATGPIRTKRTGEQLGASIRKRKTGKAGGSGSGARNRETERDEEEVMDPDEVVMFFWTKTPAVRERREQEAEDRKREEVERASRMDSGGGVWQ
ncbi:hypothetical protein C8J57DRAFT_1463594 [Mycena rebaudengoi]|nr:hypothetical protein C8J57DRAFT_1463594 [Mycena rebaudengoi]